MDFICALFLRMGYSTLTLIATFAIIISNREKYQAVNICM